VPEIQACPFQGRGEMIGGARAMRNN